MRPDVWFRSRFVRRMCVIATSRPAPATIPVGGDYRKLKARNFFTLSFHSHTPGVQFTVEEVRSDGKIKLTCSRKAKRGIQERVCWATAASIARRRFHLVHYFKLQQIRFSNALDFLAFRFCLGHWYLHATESAIQYVFNTRKLTAAKRMRALQIAVQNLNSGSTEVSPWDLYAGSLRRIARHPRRVLLLQQNSFILDSFLESGELEKAGSYRYRVMPKALATLDSYSLENRRHRSLQLLQVIGLGVAGGQLLNVTPGTALDRLLAFAADQYAHIKPMAESAIVYLQRPWIPGTWALTAAQYLKDLF